MATSRNRRHGMSKTPTYKSWCHMWSRCVHPGDEKYPIYGGRGISVCDRWKLFENFLADMGVKPDGLSIDRINNDGNYEPGNCRWATSVEQNRNRCNNRPLEAFGKVQILRDWSVESGLSESRIHYALKRGETLERYLSEKSSVFQVAS